MAVLRTPLLTAAVLLLGVICVATPSHGTELVWDSETGWTAQADAQCTEAERLYRHGRELFVKGEMIAALDAFGAIREKHPGSPYELRAGFAQARCLDSLGRFDEAVQLCEELRPLADSEAAMGQMIDLEMAVIEKISKDHPERADELLSRLAESAPDAERRTAVQDTLARVADKPPAPVSAEITPVEEDEALPEFHLGLEILQSCRQGLGDDERLRAAKEHFQVFLSSNPRTKRDASRAYIRAIDGILDATEPEMKLVYYAMTYMPEGGYAEARRILKRISKRFQETRAGELASFQYAESLYLDGRLWKAFDAYSRFLESYPETDLLPTLTARALAIAEAMLDRDKPGKAITVLMALIKMDPFGAQVDDGWMYLGRAYMKREDYPAARESFAAIPRDFPRSEWSKAAVFFAGKADFQEAELSSDHAELLANAKEAFELYLWQAPQGTFADEARSLLQDTVEQQAASLFAIAQFYEKTRKHQSAAWYYGLLSRDYPDSPHAESAAAIAKRYSDLGFRMP